MYRNKDRNKDNLLATLLEKTCHSEVRLQDKMVHPLWFRLKTPPDKVAPIDEFKKKQRKTV